MPTNNDLKAVERAHSELLVAPPEIDMAFLSTLLTWAEGEPPSVTVAAKWAASLLVGSPHDADHGLIPEDLLLAYWNEVRAFRLGHATDWLTKCLGGIDGYDDPRGVMQSFVHNALDFAPHAGALCAPLLEPTLTAAEQQASARVADVLDQRPILKAGLAQGSAETSLQLVTRAKALFQAHEGAQRLRRSART